MHFSPIKIRLKNIYLFRHTLLDMALKQFKAKYAGSILGISWALINPLLIMAAVSFVFIFIFKVEMRRFPLFALSGIFPWMFFSNALFETTPSILNQQSLIRQFNLPREIIPLSLNLSIFLNFLIGWIILYPLFLFFNPKIIYLFPLLIALLLLNFTFICGLSLSISILNVFFRDISHLLGVLLTFWFWVTPIFYSQDMIPIKFNWISHINPMTPFIVSYQDIVFWGRMPNPHTVSALIAWVGLSLLSGLLIFSSYESRLLKQI